MNSEENFEKFYNSEECQNFIKKCNEIKNNAAKHEKRISIIIVVSLISTVLLGYVSLGILGAVVFAIILYTAATFMFFSIKKQAILNYLNYYRTKLPTILAPLVHSEKVTSEELDFSNTELCNFFPGTKYQNRMSHFYYFNGRPLMIAYAKTFKGNEEIHNGLCYCAENQSYVYDAPVFIIKSEKKYDSFILIDEAYENVKLYSNNQTFDISFCKDFINKLNDRFDEFYICISKNSSLYIPFENEYLSGRIEKKDDLEIESLKLQLDYLNLGVEFYNLFEEKTL